MQKLNAVIVGAGLMGRWHAHYARKSGVRVAAIVDPDLTKGKQLAKRFGGASCASSLEEIDSAIPLDVVHLCTPLATHEGLIVSALERGLHVIAEKPLGIDARSTDYLYGVAKKYDRLLCPVHQFAYQKGVIKLVDDIKRLGLLRGIDLRFHSAGGEGKAPEELDAIVADILPHAISLLQIFCREFSSDSVWTSTHTGAGEMSATTDAGGTVVSLDVSMSVRPATTFMVAYGDRSSAYLDLFHGFSYIMPGKVSRLRKIVGPFDQSVRQVCAATANLCGRVVRNEPAYPGLPRLIRLFYAAVREGRAEPIDAEAAIDAARCRDKLIESARLLGDY